jgi:hypothetical protein
LKRVFKRKQRKENIMAESPRTTFNVIHPVMGIGALTRDILRTSPAEVILQGVQAETEIAHLRQEVARMRRLLAEKADA